MHTLQFVLDKKIVEIDFLNQNNYTTNTTVLNYLRSLPNHKGVKEGCAEGDCGACTVVLAELQKNGDLKYTAVNSCLLLIPQLHGKQLITIENLNNNKELHPVQKAMIESYGSQCGYCTPGVIMSLFALYKQDSQATEEEIIESLTGNLCRCTGYSQILEAAKKALINKIQDSFDLEKESIITLLSKIKKNTSVLFSNKPYTYNIPNTLRNALEIKETNPAAIIINGSTDIALKITKKQEILTQILDLSMVEELKQIIEETDYYEIGAGVNLEELRIFAKHKLSALYELLNVFGALQIRNKGTLAGNIASASPVGDTIPLLTAYKAEIKLVSPTGTRNIPISDFIQGYRKTILRSNEIIKSIIIPKPKNNEIIKFYKVSKRKKLDISTVSVAFYLKKDENGIVEDMIICYGGMAEKPKRAEFTEKQIISKKWIFDTLKDSQKFINQDFIPISDARAEAEARLIMAENLLLKFWNDTKNVN